MGNIRLKRAVGAAALAVLVVGCLALIQAQQTDKQPVKADYQLSGPFVHDNLTIFLIHGADQFKGKSLDQIKLVKAETKENIQAVSGATYSSRGVTKGVKEAAQVLIDKYGAGVKSAMQEVAK